MKQASEAGDISEEVTAAQVRDWFQPPSRPPAASGGDPRDDVTRPLTPSGVLPPAVSSPEAQGSTPEAEISPQAEGSDPQAEVEDASAETGHPLADLSDGPAAVSVSGFSAAVLRLASALPRPTQPARRLPLAVDPPTSRRARGTGLFSVRLRRRGRTC